MKIKTITCIAASLLCYAQTNAQTASQKITVKQNVVPKQIVAQRVTEPIKIDGLITDNAWKTAPAALGYTEFRPTPFKAEDPANRTEVYMLYNDEGIYIGGYCHERTKDSISKELTGRDILGSNDFIGFIFDTYNDKINAFEYFLTPLGEQMDAKMAPNPNGNSEDFSWNAVWKSGAVIHEDGWSFEIFLPFSAIRFSKKNIQDWGLNITRRRQKTQQQYTWNTIDPTVNGFLTQEGQWTGLQNVNPPLRLQFTPYFSTYANHYPINEPGQKNWSSSVNGGMDVKYGISQALTLDMTLIPDFGQVRSDNTILNLSPFEVKYDENRPFFTEGTELFGKGNLFYSRRVGGRPMHFYDVYDQLGANEKIISNPIETKMANATKISGRLNGGLGIGFFNAITNRTYATIEDANKNKRKLETNPLTNYNIIVLDQTLKNNSSVSLINTNVWRSGKDYDANVTAALFDLYDKKNMWNLGGKLGSSNLFNYKGDGKTSQGYSANLYFGKASGKLNFQYAETVTDDKFNISDLGYFTFNNFWEHSFWVGHNWSKPTNWYNNLRMNFNASYTTRLKNPTDYASSNINLNFNGQLKNLMRVSVMGGYEPAPHDYYEPRKEGKFFKGWNSSYFSIEAGTNRAKKYQIYAELFYVNRSLFNGNKISINVEQGYRFSDKFSIFYSLELEPQKRNIGFAGFMGNDVVFGKRDVSSVENSLNLKYNFNNKMGITADIRHYWSKVTYHNSATDFFLLQNDGSLQPVSNYTGNPNQNYNDFYINAVYTWQFAPGSFINIVWKNTNPVDNFNREVKHGYFKNLDKTISQAHNNNISLKVLYFLDYLDLKKNKQKK